MNHHNVTHFKIDMDRVEVAPVLPLRKQIELALEVAANVAMQIPTEENFARVANLQEQLVIMDAIDYKFIVPLPERPREQDGSITDTAAQLDEAGFGHSGQL